MDKAKYLELLSDASIVMTRKFVRKSEERPRTRGRPPKYYHRLLEKGKQLTSCLKKNLPASISRSLCPSGSRLAHLYGLPKMHKQRLSMRPILSATGIYNYSLAKWLDEKLKPFSINEYWISDPFDFGANRNRSIREGDILVSYDVSSLFTSIPLDETIHILVDKVFTDNWFNRSHNLDLRKDQLIELL